MDKTEPKTKSERAAGCNCENCDCCPCRDWRRKRVYYHRGGEALYGLGVIGAAIFYFQHATTFWLFILGAIKAIFWPAVVVYEVLRLLGQ